MAKDQIKLSASETLELNSSLLAERQAAHQHNTAADRTQAVFRSILKKRGKTDIPNVEWELRVDGEEVLLETEIPDEPEEQDEEAGS